MIPHALMVGAEYAAYRDVLARNAALAPAEWSFKSDPAYRAILEHVSHGQGLQYLEVLNESPWWGLHTRVVVAQTAMENDLIGHPITEDFPSLGIFCSPTNLRYAVQAFAILDHIVSLDMPNPNIIEIGGGYGGLALFLRRLSSVLRVPLNSHTIVDVPEARAIQQAFAQAVGIQLMTSDQDAVLSGGDQYLVSAYGFSEFSPVVRAHYEQAIIKHCAHGYLVWNMIPVYPFTMAPLTIEDERPLTGPGNKIVTF